MTPFDRRPRFRAWLLGGTGTGTTGAGTAACVSSAFWGCGGSTDVDMGQTPGASANHAGGSLAVGGSLSLGGKGAGNGVGSPCGATLRVVSVPEREVIVPVDGAMPRPAPMPGVMP